MHAELQGELSRRAESKKQQKILCDLANAGTLDDRQLAQVKAAREMAESPPFYYDSELDEYWGNGREPT